MSELNANSVITALAESVVFAKPEDLPVLAKIHEELETLTKLTEQQFDSQVTDAAKRSAKWVESIILRDAPDPVATLDAVSKTIAALQMIVVEGVSQADVVIPQHPGAADSNQDADDTPQGADARNSKDADPLPVASEQIVVPGNASAEPAPDAAGLPEEEPQILCADLDLVGGFVAESKEHLDEVDVQLLALESGAIDPDGINAIFRAFHTIKGVAGFLELTAVQSLAHEVETLLDQVRKDELALDGAVLDVVFDANDAMKRMVDAVAQALNEGCPIPPEPGLSDLILRIRAAINGDAAGAGGDKEKATPAPEPSQDPAPLQQDTSPPPTQLQDATKQEIDSEALGPSATAAAPQPAVAAATGTETKSAKRTAPVATGAVKETIKVEADRLDKLIDAIGELVIAETMVSQSARIAQSESAGMRKMLNQLDKITRELQELAMSLRMVPVRSTFQRMARLARDVAKKVDKRIDFVTSGEETELDKTVVDAIADPLVHMVRNAVDHGLEKTGQQRRDAGKSEVGRIELRSFHKGGSIYIEIEDDGRGLDRNAILEKAKSRGIVKDSGENLSDSDVFALIFEPGFSTAEKITDVSGRGVGLDVVKRNIQAMRGKVEIRSEKGKGCIFSIRLPLTLAIIEGMVVRVGDQRYIIPTLSIVRMIRPNESDVSTVFERGEMLRVGDRLVPLFRLNRIFGIAEGNTELDATSVVVVEDDGRQFSFVIDELLGQQQIVIKPLGKMFKGIPGLAGGAIMADGKVGLILDVAGLVKLVNGTEPTCNSAAA